MTAPRRIALLVLAVVACQSAPALADEPRPEERRAAALAAKQEGDKDVAEKHYLEALAAYDRAWAIEPSPALLYNRGRALQFLGRYAESIDSLEEFKRRAPQELILKLEGLDALLVELKGKVGSILVRCDVGAARVLLGGQDMGPAIGHNLRLNAGKISLEVLAEGYFPFRKEVELRGGQALEVNATLASRALLGLLVVKSRVPTTTVFVDGRSLGLAPAEALLSAGAHPVRVASEGFDAAETQVVLGLGERKEIVLDPLRSKPLTAKWWFWTGLGVVAATAVVVAVAATTERGAPNGDFSPGQVRR